MNLKFVVLKLFRGLSLLAGLSALVFFLARSSPVDPVGAYVGDDLFVTATQCDALAAHWSLERPPLEQYFTWLKNIVSGDMGESRIYGAPVAEVIGAGFSTSFVLMGISWTLSGFVGFCLGLVAAVKKGTAAGRIIRWFSYIQAPVPTFWLGLSMLSEVFVFTGNLIADILKSIIAPRLKENV